MGNINEVFERMERHEAQIAAALGNMDGYLQTLATMTNVLERAEVRGGLDVQICIGLGTTSQDAATVGQVIQQVKRETGMVYGLISFNAEDSARYARLYQTGAVPRVGYSPMRLIVGLPSGSGAVFFSGIGIPFSGGIWAAASVGPTDSTADIVSPTANKVLAVVFYK